MYNTDDHLFKFKERLKVLNRSSATIDSYAYNVTCFVNDIDQGDMRMVSRSIIEDYISGLYDYRFRGGKRYLTSTICVKVRAIKRFFEFLTKSNVIFIDPTEEITEPKIENRLIEKALTNKEIKKVLDQPNLGDRMGIRDRTVLETFYSTGIRINELCSLTVFDADLPGKLLRINKGKGQKDRVLPLGRHAAKFLREYISKVRPHFTKKNRSSRQLFVSQSGTPYSKQSVGIMIRTYAKAARIKQQVSAHTFRHTVATMMLKNGANIREVQQLMGHASIRTTQRYIHALGLNIKKAHKKSHPRERDKVNLKSIKPKIERIIE